MMKFVLLLLINLSLIFCFNLRIDDLIFKDGDIIKYQDKFFISIPIEFNDLLMNTLVNYYNEKKKIGNITDYLSLYKKNIKIYKNNLKVIDFIKSKIKNDCISQCDNRNKKQEFINLISDNESEFYIKIGIVSGLTLFAGLMSGLTVGYLSIDDLILELKLINGTDKEKKNAKKVLPILSKRHWLLVTLLLMNAAAMEALPIFLNDIVPEYLAVIISVTLVLLFGEIIPQAVCTGPNQINIAAFLSYLTSFLMYLTSPVSYPIGLLLDKLFGEHSKSRFLNTDLKTLIELHTHNALATLNNKRSVISLKGDDDIGLNQDQANIMIAALEVNKKTAKDIMIKFEDTFMIDYEKLIGQSELSSILEKGFSRIPVYSGNKNNLVGLLRIKELVGIDFSEPKSLKDLEIDLKRPLIIDPNINIFELLGELRKGKSHMAIITQDVEILQNRLGLNRMNSLKNDLFLQPIINDNNDSIKIEGILTLEDIIENMINLDILDEDDYEKLKRITKNSEKISKLRPSKDSNLPFISKLIF